LRYPFGYRKNYNTLIFNIIKNNLKKRGEVRKKLLLSGMDNEKISEITGLSKQELDQF
jgi:hypothetical protein